MSRLLIAGVSFTVSAGALSWPAVAALMFATTAPDYPHRVVNWTPAPWGQTPPIDCTIGPLPIYTVDVTSWRDMTARYPSGYPATFGVTLYPHTLDNPTNIAAIWMAYDVPDSWIDGILEHEKAHLRGCQH